MSETIVAVEQERTSSIDWPAVIAGALIASALSFVLFTFGTAAGVASVSPYSWSNPSASTLTWIGAIWFCLVTVGSIMLGGYFTGRYRSANEVATHEEREARDGAHGLLVWALTILLGVALATMLAGATARGVTDVVGSAAQNASHLIEQMPGELLRGAQDQKAQDPRAELAKVLSTAAFRRQIGDDDRNYAAQIVANETRTSPEDARKRIDAVIERGREAVESARKAAVGLAFLIGAISVIAAGAAYWAATAGGNQRDLRG